MINITQKHNCYGCGACFNACPNDSITMIEDSEGFLYPHVDKDSCDDCGQCEEVCPAMKNHSITPSPRVYACKNKDPDLRLESASGGMTTPLANYVLDKGGVVFGAVYDENFNVLHAYVESKEELSRIEAKDISPKKIAVIKPSATLDEALKKMKDSRFERLPVVDNNELVGIITVKDILSFHPELYPEIEEFARIREESNKLKLVQKAKERMLSQEGICEECGNQDILYKVNGMLICESCKNS